LSVKIDQANSSLLVSISMKTFVKRTYKNFSSFKQHVGDLFGEQRVHRLLIG